MISFTLVEKGANSYAKMYPIGVIIDVGFCRNGGIADVTGSYAACEKRELDLLQRTGIG